MKNTGASSKHECYTIQKKKLEACMKLHVYKNLPNPLLNELITIENLYSISLWRIMIKNSFELLATNA
jgi:hypothetical protein